MFLQGVWFKNEFIQNKSCVGWKQEVFRSNYLSKYETKLIGLMKTLRFWELNFHLI